MLTKESPPIIVDPNVERLLVGDMLEIRDMILDRAVKVSDARGIPIKRVRIQLWEDPEYDWEDVIFEVHLVSDQETAFKYWDAISDEVAKFKRSVSEDMQYTINYHVGVTVEWL